MGVEHCTLRTSNKKTMRQLVNLMRQGGKWLVDNKFRILLCLWVKLIIYFQKLITWIHPFESKAFFSWQSIFNIFLNLAVFVTQVRKDRAICKCVEYKRCECSVSHMYFWISNPIILGTPDWWLCQRMHAQVVPFKMPIFSMRFFWCQLASKEWQCTNTKVQKKTDFQIIL